MLPMSNKLQINPDTPIKPIIKQTSSNNRSSLDVSLKLIGHVGSDKCLKAFVRQCKGKSEQVDYINKFQRFIKEFSAYTNSSDAIKSFTSKNGSKVDNEYTKRIISNFKQQHPNGEEILGNAEDLLHLHFNKNGKGESVIFGTLIENVFYIIAFDLKHSFQKS
jgi:hypothetical protein